MCHPSPGRPGCGGTAVTAETLEAVITEAVLQRVDSPALAQALAERADKHHGECPIQLAQLEQRLAQLDHDFYVEGHLDRKRWLTVKAELEDRRRTLLAQITARTQTTALNGYTTAGVLRATWPRLSIDQRRAILTALIGHITIKPATKAGRRFDTERIDISWLV
jgi:hypothetical protein